MLRGMLGGLGAFVIFCALVALWPRLQAMPAFVLATAAAVVAQLVVAAALRTGACG